MFRTSMKREQPSINIRLAYDLSKGPRIVSGKLSAESTKVANLETLPAGGLVYAARLYPGNMTASFGDITVNAESLQQVMSLGANEGDIVTLAVNDDVDQQDQEKFLSDIKAMLGKSEEIVSGVIDNYRETGSVESAMDLIRNSDVEESSFSRYLKGKF